MADEKKIILSVGLDATQAAQGIDNLKTKLGGVNNTQIDKPFTSFKAAIKDATNEAANLQRQFGQNSNQFKEAAQRVATLKANYGDFSKTVQAFNPENRLQPLVSVARTATQTVQGLTAGFNLLGLEGSNTEKAILKLQSITALGDLLGQVDDLKDGFKNVQTVFGGVVKSLGTLRGALIATGIGAFAVGLGLIISNFDKIKSAIENAIPGAKQLFQFIGTVVDKVKSWVGATDDLIDRQKALEEASSEFRKIADAEYKAIDRVTQLAVKRARVRGATEEEINNLEIEGINKKLARLQDAEKVAIRLGADRILVEQERQRLLDNLQDKQLDNQIARADKSRANSKRNSEKDLQELSSKIKQEEDLDRQRLEASNEIDKLVQDNRIASIQDEFTRKQNLIEADKQSEIDKFLDLKNKKLINDDQYEKAKQEITNKYSLQQSELLLEKTKKDADAVKAILDQTFQNPFTNIQNGGLPNFNQQTNAVADKENGAIDSAEALRQQKIEAAKGDALALEQIEAEFQKNISDIQKGASEERKAIKQAELEFFLGETSKVLGNITEIVGKNTVAGKAIAIAEGTISATLAGINAFNAIKTAKTPVEVISAIALSTSVLAKGLALVRQIKNVKIPNTAGGSGGGSAPSIAAPSISATSTASQAIQDVRVTNTNQQQPIRAFIVDRDIQNNEERRNFLNSISTF